MSRSRRKIPVCSTTASGLRGSEKKDKQYSARKFRRIERKRIKRKEYDNLPQEQLEVFNMPNEGRKDGKSFFDPIEDKKLLRK